MNAFRQYGWLLLITVPLLSYVLSLFTRRTRGQGSMPAIESSFDPSVEQGSVPTDPAFRMTVQDVFSISGRGTVVTGRIESGMLSVGNDIHIKSQGSENIAVVSGIETAGKILVSEPDDDEDDAEGISVASAQAGVDVGILLRNISKSDVHRGDVLTGR